MPRLILLCNRRATEISTTNPPEPAPSVLISSSSSFADQQNEGSTGNASAGSGGAAAGGPVTQIIYTNSPGSTHSSLDIARDREEALTKNDMFWQKRINQIEVAHNRSQQVLEKEYNQSVSILLIVIFINPRSLLNNIVK